MAVSSATSSTASTGKGIDVATIVSGLMDVERAPVTKLQGQVDQKTLVISTLGVFKSKVSALESAAKVIQTPGVFSLRTTSSSDATKVSATASNAASTGTYSVKVAQTAQAAALSVGGFTAANQNLDLTNFSLTLGSITYQPAYAKLATPGPSGYASGDKILFTLNGETTPQTFEVASETTAAQVGDAINAAVLKGTLRGVSASVNSDGSLQLSSSNPIQGLSAKFVENLSAQTIDAMSTQDGLTTAATIANLKDWINALGANIEANLVQIGTQDYSLSLAATKTGSANTLSVIGISALASGGGGTYQTLTPTTLQSARDAFFSVNGLAVQRSSNSVSDVVSGVTFDLNAVVTPVGGAVSAMPNSTVFDALTATTVNVTAGTQDLATSAVTDFVTAYNDLLSFYKEQSASSTDAKKRGVLNTDTSLRTYMERLRGLYGKGVRLADGGTLSFSAIGIEIQRDGSLYLNTGKLNSAVADGLQSKFAEGVTLGYESATSSLTSFLTNSLKATTGLLTSHIKDTENQQSEIQKKIDDWEVRLARVQERYYRQYAALDALIFKLQNTSDALGSAIQSLVNSQKNG